MQTEFYNKKGEMKIVPMDIVQNEMLLRFPLMYDKHFLKYNIKERIKVLSDLFDLYTD
jgi:hypothetical protein